MTDPERNPSRKARSRNRQSDVADDPEIASTEHPPSERGPRNQTMTHKHKLDEFTPWKVESYDLHDEYDHGNPPTAAEEPAIAVTNLARGPDAIVLERALFLHGYTRLVTTPDEDPGHEAPRADDGRAWLDIPQVSLIDVRVTLPDGRRVQDGKDWPARAERIDVDTLWNLNGARTRKTLTTDLAFGRTDISNPRFAYPFVTADSRLTSETHKRLILVAYSACNDEPSGEELAEDRATAEATADITLNGRDGWLTAVNRLVRKRVLPCLPAEATPPQGIRILLHDERTVPVKTETYRRTDPLRKPIETEPGPGRERANRLRYERGPFDGHRGILLGRPVELHSRLWQKLVAMHDAERGEALWEPESAIHGRAIKLDDTLRGMAWDEGHQDAQHGVVWTLKTHRLPSATLLNYIATTGGDPEQPEPVTVHVLTAAEHDQLRQRILGPLLQAVVDHEKEHGEHAANGDHPLQNLLAECEARRETSLTRM